MCLFLITHPTKAEFSETEEQQIQHIIEKYLSQNPELLFDLIVNYSNQKSEDAKQSAMSLTYDSEGDGTMGNSDASFIIYEYSDYNCGYCKRLFNTLQTLISEDDDLLIVVKEFPILAKSSVLAAKAALAAEEQGRFAEYHNALMTSVGGITQESLQSIATMVGLDLSLYNEAISSNRFDKILQRNMNAGRAIVIEGTPALLIGEQIIPGAIGLEEIKALIKAERENS
jgi:protein-disulfide isomerase